ncbi:MAG: RNA polymerase sigma factor [Bacteroidia bacterium]|nr:RNA polymerase sigma factor [Bacteroidia bacterium]
MNEQDFIEALKAGDNTAFAKLIEDYKNKVYNSCLGIVQSEAEAEDITQEIFVEVWHSVKNFRGDSKLSTWIYRMSINRSLDYLRKKKRKKAAGLLSLFTKKDSLEPIVDPPDFHHPGVALENKETSAILFAAIDKLPEKQKTAFVLQNIENLSMKEIAEVMQTTPSAVESLLSRARENLKKLLGDYFERNKKNKPR